MKFQRIVRYFAIMAGVSFIAYCIQSIAGLVIGRQGSGALAAAYSYYFPAVDLVAAIVAAALNRRFAFRSALAWGVAIPVMALLEMLFDMLTGMCWRPVLQGIMDQAIQQSAEPLVGDLLMNAAFAFNLAQFVLWAVLAYLFQRFVLYRENLDTNALVVGAHGYKLSLIHI